MFKFRVTTPDSDYISFSDGLETKETSSFQVGFILIYALQSLAMKSLSRLAKLLTTILLPLKEKNSAFTSYDLLTTISHLPSSIVEGILVRHQMDL